MLMKQRINARQTIQHCRRCGDLAIITDGFPRLCGRCATRLSDTAKKSRFFRSSKWKLIRQQVLAAFPVCHYCKAQKATCVDHVLPLSRGGKTVYENLVSSCRSCNSKKHTRTAEQFRSNKTVSVSERVFGERNLDEILYGRS